MMVTQPLTQLSLWTLQQQLSHTSAHHALQQRLPACLHGWELWHIDYAPKGFRAVYWSLGIFTELHATTDAVIEQAVHIGFLTETLPRPDLEQLFASYGGVLPAAMRRTLGYLQRSYPAHF